MEDEEILTHRAKRDIYQEAEFYMTKTKYINIKIKQLEKSLNIIDVVVLTFL